MSDEWEEQELVLEERRHATTGNDGVLSGGRVASWLDNGIGGRGRGAHKVSLGGDVNANYIQGGMSWNSGEMAGSRGRARGRPGGMCGGRGLRNDCGDDGNQDGGCGRGGGRAPFRGGSQRGTFGSGEPTVPYIPPPLATDEETIFSHYASGINFNKYDEIKVDVSGLDPPAAIVTFEEAHLCESLKRNVAKSGYVTPTKVQKHSIPIIAAGRDIMACAQTGSGKTAAFLLPILQNLMATGVASSAFSRELAPEAIVVAPTRELISQIYMEARKFAYGTCVRPGIVYGGVDTNHQLGNLLKGCNVLCGTPGKLLYVISSGKVGLSKIRYLVLDEADRMLGMGFEEKMRMLVGFPDMPPREVRQTVMFSATYPESIQRLAADFLKKDYLFLAVGVVGAACADVEQTVIRVTRYSKRDQLLDMVRNTGDERTLVFVERKRQADFIAAFLCQENVRTTTIHGDRLQCDRERALADFRSGRCPVLVATSVASRGLDIPDVHNVVNFDLPDNIDDYVHRIGRTGRCGNTGRAVSFYDQELDRPLARSLVKILSSAQQTVPCWLGDIALGAHGTAEFSPGVARDSREGGGFQRAHSRPDQPAAQSVAAGEDWDEVQ